MNLVPVFKPLLEQEERDAASKAIEMGWLGMGSYVNELEQALSDYLKLDDRYLAAVNTGHSALHLALIVAGVGAGDEVITPSFNCVSDFQAVASVGADVVFCEVLDENLTIDLASAEALVSDKTKALIVMDYASATCDHEAVAAFAQKHQLRVIHDAAHTFACRYKGRMVGSFSDITMLSFDPVKTMTCIDAGVIIVRTREELQRIHELRILGMGQPPEVMYQNKRAWTFHVKQEGYRYHLVNLHAAVGLQQLKKIERISQTRKQACEYYLKALKDVAEIRLPDVDLENITPFIFVIRVRSDVRDQLRTFLEEQGVDSGVHWQAGHNYEYFKRSRSCNLDVTRKAELEILSLPFHSDMDRSDQDKVIAALKAFYSQHR